MVMETNKYKSCKQCFIFFFCDALYQEKLENGENEKKKYDCAIGWSDDLKKKGRYLSQKFLFWSFRCQIAKV
jgi:hypothetical protein